MCTTGSVHTLTCCTVYLRTSAHLHACAHTRMAQVHEKSVCRMSVFVLHLAFSLLTSPYDDSLSLSQLSRPHVLAVLTCPRSAGHAHLRTRTRSLATWPSPPSTQNPDEFCYLVVHLQGSLQKVTLRPPCGGYQALVQPAREGGSSAATRGGGFPGDDAV